MWTPDLQSCQTEQSHAHSTRSAAVSFGRFTERWRTPIWWRSARISSWSAARLRNQPEKEAMSAVNTGPTGNRRMRDNPQFINQIDICENHTRFPTLSGSSTVKVNTARMGLTLFYRSVRCLRYATRNLVRAPRERPDLSVPSQRCPLFPSLPGRSLAHSWCGAFWWYTFALNRRQSHVCGGGPQAH
jgi:hypothetical protein